MAACARLKALCKTSISGASSRMAPMWTTCSNAAASKPSSPSEKLAPLNSAAKASCNSAFAPTKSTLPKSFLASPFASIVTQSTSIRSSSSSPAACASIFMMWSGRTSRNLMRSMVIKTVPSWRARITFDAKVLSVFSSNLWLTQTFWLKPWPMMLMASMDKGMRKLGSASKFWNAQLAWKEPSMTAGPKIMPAFVPSSSAATHAMISSALRSIVRTVRKRGCSGKPMFAKGSYICACATTSGQRALISSRSNLSSTGVGLEKSTEPSACVAMTCPCSELFIDHRPLSYMCSVNSICFSKTVSEAVLSTKGFWKPTPLTENLEFSLPRRNAEVAMTISKYVAPGTTISP
mmetsp:Transcript_156313/g.501507  ORF Transcript_156313/g.501507 Transcript_156313/m.501507 type:complete len:349 (-) Transcript_156313:289-1335(-)